MSHFSTLLLLSHFINANSECLRQIIILYIIENLRSTKLMYLKALRSCDIIIRPLIMICFVV